MFLLPTQQMMQLTAAQQHYRQRVSTQNANVHLMQNGQSGVEGSAQGPTSGKTRVNPFQRPDRMIRNEPCSTYNPINFDDIIGKGRSDEQVYKVKKEHILRKPCGGKKNCNFCALSEDLLGAANEYLKEIKYE